MSSHPLITVAIAGPLRRAFTYATHDAIGPLTPGQRLLVPFGKGRKLGYYLGPSEPPPGNITVKQVIKPLDEVSFFSADLFQFCLWMADYYFANPADVLACALPSMLKSAVAVRYRWADQILTIPKQVESLCKPGKKISAATLQSIHQSGKTIFRKLVSEGLVEEIWDGDASDDSQRIGGYRMAEDAQLETLAAKGKQPPVPFYGEKSRSELRELGWSEHYLGKAIAQRLLLPIPAKENHPLDFIKGRPEVRSISLNAEQRSVVDTVTPALTAGFKPFLLHGITGSGKTIVYCHLAQAVIDLHKTALVLTPEIALSGATLAYLRGFFGDQVTVIHSAMTDRERLDSWRGIRRGKYRIVVGPRSAIFAPLPDLGLIIVDEEHDGSYKQDDPSPRFHGRDCAIMRAKQNNIPVLLGSASPSIESYYHARQGRYHLLELTQRPGEAVLPEIRIVDMRTEGVKGEAGFVSLPLKKEVEKRLALDQQVILFLNRRGYSPMLRCGDCGHIPLCPSCNIRLTYHKVGHRLTCHYCGFIRSNYDNCDQCFGTKILYMGAGTQKVEEMIPKLFVGATTIRLDSDSAGGRVSAHRILNAFAQREYNLLLGTQMVTKGLDMPNVSLVGVLSADSGSDLPDFRSTEKTFARLLQVAGRSGRAGIRGEVIFQTYAPESELITDASRQDFRSFYERELLSRQECSYPPFVRLTNIIFSSLEEASLETVALEFHARLKARLAQSGITAQLLGPHPCPLYLLRKSYRRHIIVKTNQQVAFVRMLTQWEAEESRFKLPAAIKVIVDIDPDDMM
ncbi:MAG: primosomal protein N' [bacterium]|nr:primosomal protein N' [bacterium]